MTYTGHYHHIPGSPEEPLPFGVKVARCGGPGLCAVCSNAATAWVIQDLHDKAEAAEKKEKFKLNTPGQIPATVATVFQSIPADVVAIQFTGGAGLGRDIESWVKNNGGNATFREAAEPFNGAGGAPMHNGWPDTLQVETQFGWIDVAEGSWIVQERPGVYYTY